MCVSDSHETLVPVSLKSIGGRNQNFRGPCDSAIFTSFDKGPPSPDSRARKIPSVPWPPMHSFSLMTTRGRQGGWNFHLSTEMMVFRDWEWQGWSWALNLGSGFCKASDQTSSIKCRTVDLGSTYRKGAWALVLGVVEFLRSKGMSSVRYPSKKLCHAHVQHQWLHKLWTQPLSLPLVKPGTHYLVLKVTHMSRLRSSKAIAHRKSGSLKLTLST